MSETVPPRLIIWIAAGFVIWSSGFVALYALHAIGCAFAWQAGPIRLGLTAVLLLHILPLALMWRHLARQTPRDASAPRTRSFLATVALWSTVAALAATVLTLGPPLVLTTCV